MSGATFDTSYIHAVIVDQTNAIAYYQAEADSGVDAGVRTYAMLFLPKLKAHLVTADSLYAVLQTTPQ